MNKQSAVFLTLMVAVLSGPGLTILAGPGADGTTGRPYARNVVITLQPGSPAAGQFRTRVVTFQQIPGIEVKAQGRIELNVNKVAKLTLPVTGRVDQVFVQLGDRVARGETLLTIDSPEADGVLSEYRQSLASVSLAKTTLAKSQADLARIQDLYAHMAVARKELLAAEYEVEQAKTSLEQAETTSRHLLKKLRIMGLDENQPDQKVIFRAPLSGKVLDLSITAGEYRNDISSPVITLANLDTVWVTSEIPEDQIRHITVGEKIELELVAYPGETFQARVTRIADMLDTQTRTVKVRAELPNPGCKLLPEMFGTIRHSHPARDLPMVPQQAIVTRKGRSHVFLERQGGVFELVPVVTAPPVKGMVPVLQGLRGGERVVTDGVMQLLGMEGR